MRNIVISVVVLSLMIYLLFLAQQHSQIKDAVLDAAYSNCIDRANEWARYSHVNEEVRLQCQNKSDMYLGRILCNIFPKGQRPYTIVCGETICSMNH